MIKYSSTTLWMLVALLAWASCSDEKFVSDNVQPNADHSVTLTALMPSTDAPTRIGLSPADDGLNMQPYWQQEDRIKILVYQNHYNIDLGYVPLSKIYNDGRNCTFTVGLPSSIDPAKPYVLAGICEMDGHLYISNLGYAGMTFTAIQQSHSLTQFRVPVYFVAEVTRPDHFTVQFNHLGCYEVLHLQNTSEEAITFTHDGYKVDKRWWYQEAIGSATTAGLESWKEQNAYGPWNPSEVMGVAPGETGIMVSWYVPNGHDISLARLRATVNDKQYESSNTKNTTVNMQTGHAYHLYAVWDGQKLGFGKNEIQLDELRLSEQEVTVGINKEKHVYILSGNYDYEVTTADRDIATVNIFNNDHIVIYGRHSGETVITVLDKNSGKEKQIAVKVTTGNDLVEQLIKDMVDIEGGTFMMGASDELVDEGYPVDEGSYAGLGRPLHEVTLWPYKISRYEVTQGLWKAVMGEYHTVSGRDLILEDDYPVMFVSMDDVVNFIRTLNNITHQHFRLPSEAEWEYAARGADKSLNYRYAGSNTLDDVAWWKDNSDHLPHPVGQKRPNEIGLYDMTGNVAEFVHDLYRTGGYVDHAITNPAGAMLGDFQVVRGGAFNDNEAECLSTYRMTSMQHNGYQLSTIGFRLAIGTGVDSAYYE